MLWDRKAKIKEDEARAQMHRVLTKHFNIESNLLDALVTIFKLRKIKKKELFLTEKENSNKVYFVVEGLVRIYHTKSDKEITTWFLTENEFFMSVYHIFTGNDNYNNYEALEQTVVLESTYEEMQAIYALDTKLENLGRKIIENYYARFLGYIHSVLFLSAEERYQAFLKENSALLNRVALKYIASYIGVSQETLSRMRAKM